MRFIDYYGAKHALAPRYPRPRHRTIIEPFAGSAGYACLYPEHDVILIEKEPRLTAAWKWLISATRDDVMAMPLLKPGENIDDKLPDGPQKDIIGWWLNTGSARPCKRLSKWAREQFGKNPVGSWSPRCRERIASNVQRISHWKIIHGDFSCAPDIEATWFIDPPYEKQGRYYKESEIDYKDLAKWTLSRRGQMIVCENEGVEWLPFERFVKIRGMAKSSVEVVCLLSRKKSARPVFEFAVGRRSRIVLPRQVASKYYAPKKLKGRS